MKSKKNRSLNESVSMADCGRTNGRKSSEALTEPSVISVKTDKAICFAPQIFWCNHVNHRYHSACNIYSPFDFTLGRFLASSMHISTRQPSTALLAFTSTTSALRTLLSWLLLFPTASEPSSGGSLISCSATSSSSLASDLSPVFSPLTER